MSTTKLVFNGINGATGDYGLPPMSGEELSEFIRGEATPENLNELRARHRAGTQQTLGVKEGIDPKKLDEAGWGIIFNLPVAILISLFTQPNEQEKARRVEYHTFIRRYASLPPEKRHLVKWGWSVTLVWFFFAIGPGCVVGNTLFGDPKVPATWAFGMPSIWLWQIIWWILGIGMMWFLAYKLQMSTHITEDFQALKHDIYEEEAFVSEESSRGMTSP